MATNYYNRNDQRSPYRDEPYGDSRDRGLLNRAGDEVRSWLGDEQADRRRRDDRHRQNSGYDFDDVSAGEVMTRNVAAVHPHDAVERAAKLMSECDCGALPVVDSKGRLVGMVTDRDLTVRIIARGLDPRRAMIDDAMTHEVVSCHANDSIRECMDQMARRQIRRLPIVNNDNRLVGVISQADLARSADAFKRQGEQRAMADMLCAVSEPERRRIY